MREIKFRAWDKISKIYFEDMEDLPDDQFKDYIVGMYPHRIIIMMNTGIKDRYNNDIYEGDIVHHHFYHKNVVMCFYEKRVAFGGKDKRGKFLEMFPIDREYFEIIGNIHENPELLTSHL